MVGCKTHAEARRKLFLSKKTFLMSALVLPADVQSEAAIIVALEYSVFSDKICIIPYLH
jgi:hypothetical protein